MLSFYLTLPKVSTSIPLWENPWSWGPKPATVTSNRGKKQKITPEQFKLFEFALMHTGDDNKEQNLLINYNNILLQGFVNLVKNWWCDQTKMLVNWQQRFCVSSCVHKGKFKQFKLFWGYFLFLSSVTGRNGQWYWSKLLPLAQATTQSSTLTSL